MGHRAHIVHIVFSSRQVEKAIKRRKKEKNTTEKIPCKIYTHLSLCRAAYLVENSKSIATHIVSSCDSVDSQTISLNVVHVLVRHIHGIEEKNFNIFLNKRSERNEFFFPII